MPQPEPPPPVLDRYGSIVSVGARVVVVDELGEKKSEGEVQSVGSDDATVKLTDGQVISMPCSRLGVVA